MEVQSPCTHPFTDSRKLFNTSSRILACSCRQMWSEQPGWGCCRDHYVLYRWPAWTVCSALQMSHCARLLCIVHAALLYTSSLTQLPAEILETQWDVLYIVLPQSRNKAAREMWSGVTTRCIIAYQILLYRLQSFQWWEELNIRG